MNIVRGRGKNREVIELPHGSLFAQGEKNDPQDYQQTMNTIRSIVLK